MEILHAFHEGSLKKDIMSFYQEEEVELHYFEKLLLNFVLTLAGGDMQTINAIDKASFVYR